MRKQGAILSKVFCTDRMRSTGHHHREDKNPTKTNWPLEIISILGAPPCLHMSIAANSPIAERALGAAGTQAWLGLPQAV